MMMFDLLQSLSLRASLSLAIRFPIIASVLGCLFFGYEVVRVYCLIKWIITLKLLIILSTTRSCSIIPVCTRKCIIIILWIIQKSSKIKIIVKVLVIVLVLFK